MPVAPYQFSTVAANAMSSTVVLYSLLPIGTFVVSRDFQHLAWAAAVLLASLVAEITKHLTQHMGIWPAMAWCRRPAEARDCDTWNRNGPQGGAPGFPSGHVATAAAFWVGAVLLTPAPLRTWSLVGATVGIAAMAAARMKKRCHTALQTLGGGVLGALLAWAFLNVHYN